jgi:hypothetical protein
MLLFRLLQVKMMDCSSFWNSGVVSESHLIVVSA